MSATKDIQERISLIFTQKLNLEAPAHDSDLFQNGTLDSLTLVDLLAELETEFGFHLQPDQLVVEEFRSLESLARFVNRFLTESEAALGTHQTAA
jgi:acyl carrier protein